MYKLIDYKRNSVYMSETVLYNTSHVCLCYRLFVVVYRFSVTFCNIWDWSIKEVNTM